MLLDPANGVSVVLLKAMRFETIAGSGIDAISRGGRITPMEEERSQKGNPAKKAEDEKKRTRD